MKKKGPRGKRATRSPARAKPRWHEAVIVDQAKLRAWPNVELVALGWKERRKKLTRRMSVKIYVRKKANPRDPDQVLPKTAFVLVPVGRGLYKRVRLPTDVVVHTDIVFCAGPTDFLNPVLGGAQLSTPGGDTGTFACMVVNGAGHKFALTAGHVVTRLRGAVAAGRTVQQPARVSPGMPSGATLAWGQTARGGFVGNHEGKFVDFALIAVAARQGATRPIDAFPSRTSVVPEATVVNSRFKVSKLGAATGRTGAVFATHQPSITVQGVVANEVWEFVGGARPFGVRGDSGALVVSAEAGSEGAVVGILFATSAGDTPGGRAFVYPFRRLTGFRPA